MRYSLGIFILFVFASSTQAKDVTDCNLSFHAVSEAGLINEVAYLNSNQIIDIKHKGIDKISSHDLWHLVLSEKGSMINKKFTAENIGRSIAIFCDGALLQKVKIMSVSEGDFVFSVLP